MYLRSFNGAFKKKQFLKVYLENILAFYVDNLKIYTFATYIFEQNFEKWYPVKFHAWISTILFCVSVHNRLVLMVVVTKYNAKKKSAAENNVA